VTRREVENRLDALETSGSESAPVGPVSYHPEEGEYRDADGDVVDPEEYDRLIIIPTDEQIDRAVETGEFPVGPAV
jgi:hypothetical protein